MTPSATLETWKAVLGPENEDLRRHAADATPGDVASISRLRKRWNAEFVAVALELAEARRRAAPKFPELSELVADVAGVEQASSLRTARHKARRLTSAGIEAIDDLCCGIGGDAMALAEVLETRAIDLDPIRAWMAQTNARCSTAVADVTTLDDSTRAFHVDPARRDESTGRRSWSMSDLRPGVEFLERLVASGRPGVMKLGPGLDLERWTVLENAEVEVLNEGGRLVQAVVWCNDLCQSPGLRRATRIDDDVSMVGVPGRARVVPIGSWLYAVDPALERTRLTHILAESLDLGVIHDEVDILSGDEELPASPWLTPFRVLQVMPWRENKVRRWLRDHDGGIVEVKTRGGVVNPDEVQRALRGSGSTTWTLFILRLDDRVTAVVTARA